ncbi:GNAT family N-acetyltransferase [Rhizobium sp. 11_C7_N12_5]|uniref:GNAT family N-acetyltransferase n=1 Tax=Rhizobium sp. 11_C7_N12_5 TaxID=3240770 RepID=UPI003F252AED
MSIGIADSEKMQFSVALAGTRDIASWMALAEQVTPLFGPMPDFGAVLERKILRKQAFCARRTAGTAIAGGMLIGGAGTEFWIRWLAVSSEHWRHGIGRTLVKTAITKALANSVIYVDTFAEGSAGAEAAAGLYRSCCFKPTEIWTRDGVTRQRYARKPAELL